MDRQILEYHEFFCMSESFDLHACEFSRSPGGLIFIFPFKQACNISKRAILYKDIF